MGRGLRWTVWLLAFATSAPWASAGDTGRDIYQKRCFWCHGEKGDGDGPAAEGIFPRPRDFVRADYKIRSTPHGQLPTDEDLFRVITRGMPGTPMPGWEGILSEKERRDLVSYLKNFSPRFQGETREPLGIPPGAGSVERGREAYRSARCFLCHGEAGRGDGGITTTMAFEWGLPHFARDFTRGWTFKGGGEPRDIYLRITGGLNGTPMGPYRDLLSDQERWDLAHYVASLDREGDDTSDDFVVTAAHIEGEVPINPEDPAWQEARPILVPLAGQVIIDPPSRWWTPTAGSATIRGLWNGSRIGYLLQWNDPTGPDPSLPDAASLQFAAREGSKPYFHFGSPEDPVRIWRWQTGQQTEEWIGTGTGSVEPSPPGFEVNSVWKEGYWQVVFRGFLEGEPGFRPGRFVPVLLSVGDGANAEFGRTTAISTWLYSTLEPRRSARPFLWASVWLLGAVLGEIWVLSRLKP